MKWGRRISLAVIVVALAAVAAMTRADPAFALVDPIVTTEDWAKTNDLLNANEATTELPCIKSKTGCARAWFKSKRIIGRVPSWASAGSGITGFTLAAGSALYLGWEIGHASGASDWAYGKVLGWGETAQPQPSTGSIRAYYWKVALATGAVYDGTTLSGSPTFSTTAAWVPQVRYSTDSGATWSTRNGYVSGCVFPGDGVLNSPCNNGTFIVGTAATTAHGTCNVTTTEGFILGALEASGHQGGGQVYAREYIANGDYACDIVYGEGTSQAMDRFAPTEFRPYASTTDAFRKTNTAATGVPKPDPHPAFGSSDQVAAEAAIVADQDLATELDEYLHPSAPTTPDDTVLLPQPMFNETYSHYRARLRALGFLGTITLSENVGVDVLPEFGPNVVTEVQVTTTTGTETYPLLSPWPDPPATLTVPGTDTDITIEYNPDDAPAPGPDDPGGENDPPPGNAPPPGGGDINIGSCSCPGPDFGPVTDIDYGDKFPFAAIASFEGLLGTTLFASPDAPVFDFDFTSFEAGDFGPYNLGHYTVDLEVYDDYMAIIRTLISWAIWVGGLWWFGSRWLGFHGTGDPGEVVDEVY